MSDIEIEAVVTENNSENETASTHKSSHSWSPQRKRRKRKRKSALFTNKKKRTTTSNIRVPQKERRKLYRDRHKHKKVLIKKGLIENEAMPPVNYEQLDANYLALPSNKDKKIDKAEVNNANNRCRVNPRRNTAAHSSRYNLRSKKRKRKEIDETSESTNECLEAAVETAATIKEENEDVALALPELNKYDEPTKVKRVKLENNVQEGIGNENQENVANVGSLDVFNNDANIYGMDMNIMPLMPTLNWDQLAMSMSSNMNIMNEPVTMTTNINNSYHQSNNDFVNNANYSNDTSALHMLATVALALQNQNNDTN